jgi:sensor histidine kinase YesM
MHYKYKSNLDNIIMNRFSVTLYDMKSTIENSLKIGANLSELRNTQSIIDQVKANDENILSVKVFEGKIGVYKTVFDNDKDSIGKGIPAPWKNMLETSKLPVWKLKEKGVTAIGTNFMDGVGHIIGGVTIRYANSHSSTNENMVALGLYKRLLCALVTCFLLLLVLIRLFFRKPLSTLSYMLRFLTDHSGAQEKIKGSMDANLLGQFSQMLKTLEKETDEMVSLEKSLSSLEKKQR